MSPTQSAIERVTAEHIADVIARLMRSNISRAEVMVEIAKQFPDLSYRMFLQGLCLYERQGRGSQ
jgi:hypothetical protein